MALHGMIAAPLARVAIEYAASRGADRLALYRLLGVLPEEALQPERRIPLDAMFAVWESCMRRLRDPAFPLKVAQCVRIEDYHVLGYAVMTSRNAREAMERVARYGRMLSTPGHWRISEEADTVLLEWRREGPRTLGHRVANECAVAEFFHTLRQLSGTRLTPLRVSFQHPAPEDTREHERFFGTRVVFGDTWDGCTLPRAAMEISPRAANPVLSAYLDSQLQLALKALPEDDSPLERVRVLIAQELASGEPSMQEIAAQLHLSVRTLRRELTTAGTTFRELIEQLRRERALELLRAERASLSEVAFLLGFSEASAFTRAFKRWYGVPPGEFRKVA